MAGLIPWRLFYHSFDVPPRVICCRIYIYQTRASRRLRTVAISARLAPSHASYRGPELVWATGRLMSPDRGFGTSCLLHCGHLTASANSEDS